jgi:hypothetical protein
VKALGSWKIFIFFSPGVQPPKNSMQSLKKPRKGRKSQKCGKTWLRQPKASPWEKVESPGKGRTSLQKVKNSQGRLCSGNSRQVPSKKWSLQVKVGSPWERVKTLQGVKEQVESPGKGRGSP